jgi:glucose/mannose-6-phosphate isomerase
MEEALINFLKQFSFDPQIQNSAALQNKSCFIVSGVGGSALSADLLKVWNPNIELIVHRNFGLPSIPPNRISDYLFIACSYSGNTEEVRDGLAEALKKGMAVAVIAIGGKLLEEAREKNLPYIELIDYGIPTRMALGLSAKALVKLMGQSAGVKELAGVEDLNAKSYEEAGKGLAKKMSGHIPMIYASQRNMPLAYAWKIQFNEISKIPAFANCFPELSHNEINGFDGANEAKQLAQKFYFIFLKDSADDPRIQKRMELLQGILNDHGLPFGIVDLEGDEFHKIFSSLLVADWAAFELAGMYGTDKATTSVVEKLKKAS